MTPDGPIRAPELTGAIAWLNVPAPLTLKALRGKVVLLDFWTYGCINCIHILPDLKKLEARFPNELVVIGVHAAKFANEQATENIRQIIRRYEIAHPVANDAEFRIWRAYTRARLAVARHHRPGRLHRRRRVGRGQLRGLRAGDRGGHQGVRRARRAGPDAALATAPESDGVAATTLKFPGKVLATPAVACSSATRIITRSSSPTSAAKYPIASAPDGPGRVDGGVRRGRVPQTAGTGAG